ncbi:polycomb group RING finger protein 6 isoform X2 [Dendropsophus ebraccatus]|uniref:polycomb group RING finger protein 6 isoform X2 n=1 Tax=Dendropsophus ebraccatus TaxID=150705 RepID=UPI0038319686
MQNTDASGHYSGGRQKLHFPACPASRLRRCVWRRKYRAVCGSVAGCRGGMELEFGNSMKCENEEGTSLSFTAADITSSSFGEEDVGKEEVQSRGDEHMINLADLNPYILCSICKGYFIDATTITECLHTFCKSCIVRHFYYSNRCPKCNVVVHQTQPLYNIRLDRQLQDIVFKLVVNLEEREKKQLYDFYQERGLEVPKPAVPQSVFTGRGRPKKPIGPLFRIPPELDVSLLLEFMGAGEGTGSFKVDIICGDHLLEHYQTLREILAEIGKSAVQDGLLVLHFGLVLSPLSLT